MAKPPFDAPVLFDVQSESSTIKQGKDGSYKLVLEGVDKVHWETDDTEAEEAYYSAKKYAKNYDNYYGKDAEVSAYETFTLKDGTREKCKFTISNVKYKEKSNKLVYDIEPANTKQADKITGIESETRTASAVYSTQRTRWRPDWMPNGYQRDLYRADLKDADLMDADLRVANLRGADLRGADLRGAQLYGADLRDAKLRGVELVAQDMVRADLRFTDLRGADLSDAKLNVADLRHADLRFSDLIDADLKFSRLRGADLREADLRDAELNRADLIDTYLRFADLRVADLRLAELIDADLGDADLRGADLRDADLSYTDLRGANLGGAYLYGADLTGAVNMAQAINLDGVASWGRTTCPDGTLNNFFESCSEDQLIPLA